MKKIFRVFAALALFLVPLANVPITFAAADTCTWDGSANGNWSNGANWSGCDNGGVPESGDSLVFPDAAANKTNTNDLVGLNLVNVSFTGGLYSILGNALTITPSSSSAISFSGANNAWSVPTTISGTSSKSIFAGGNGNVIAGDLILSITGGQMNFGSASTTALAISGVVSGSADGVVISPDATVSMSNTNTYTSTATFINNNAELICNTSACLGSSSADISMYGNALISFYSGVTFSENIDVFNGANSPAQIYAYGNTTLSGDITTSDDMSISGASGVTIDLTGNIALGAGSQLTLIGAGDPSTDIFDQNTGVISGAGILSVEGAMATIQGNNTYTGETHVNNDGVLDIRHANSLGTTAGATTIHGSGTLFIPTTMTLAEDLNISGAGASGYNGAVEMFAGNDTEISGDITLLSNATIANTSSGNFELNMSGVIGGTGNLIFESNTNSSDFRFSGSSANTYTGSTTVNGSILYLGKTNNTVSLPGNLVVNAGSADDALVWTLAEQQISDSSVVTLNDNGGFRAILRIDAGHTESIGGLTGDGHLQINGTRTVIENNTNITFNGTVYGPGILTKQGTGVLSLNGDFADSGSGFPAAVEIHEGRVDANPINTSFEFPTWTVTGGTLSGTQNVGPTNMNGGTFAPGNSPGCLNVAGNLTFSINSVFAAEIGGTTMCSGYDHSAVSQTATLTGATLSLSQYGGFVPTAGNTFQIISAASVVGVFNSLPDGATVTANGHQYRINYSATTVVLTYLGVVTVNSPDTGLKQNNNYANLGLVLLGTTLLYLSRRYGKISV